jgi:hypothetical protein
MHDPEQEQRQQHCLALMTNGGCWLADGLRLTCVCSNQSARHSMLLAALVEYMYWCAPRAV